MALVHRVNLNFNPLLGTYYYKCMINITRLKTKHTVKSKADYDKNSTMFKSFEQMVTFRQNQAQRTALIATDSIQMAVDVEKFCMYFGKVLNTFLYCTKVNKTLLLVEYETPNAVERLRCSSEPRHSTGAVNVITSLLSCRIRHSNVSKHKQPSTVNYYPYATFTLPSPTEIVQNLKQEKNVSQQMISLYDTLKVTELDIRLRFFTAHQMTFYLSKLFTNLSVVPFGSSVNGFGLLECDLDLVCIFKDTIPDSDKPWKKFLFLSHSLSLVERNAQTEFLEAISTIMAICIPGVTRIRKILQARVPIIKFFNSNTNMQCDLACTNMSALYMSELLYIYAQLDWRVKPLVCTIRTWARSHGLTKENPGVWMTNFSLTLLIMFYLQTKNILPSLLSIKDITVENLKNNVVEPLAWCAKWKNSAKQNKESLHELLRGFFEYYSVFDFKTQAICVREGIIKPKKDASPLYIYNPFEITLNVSKNINVAELTRIICTFQIGLEILSNSLEKDIIVKLIKLEQSVPTSRNIFEVANLNQKGQDNKQNGNNSDTNDLKCINQEMLTNEEDTNVHKNREKIIIK